MCLINSLYYALKLTTGTLDYIDYTQENKLNSTNEPVHADKNKV